MTEILDIRDKYSEAFSQFQVAIEQFLLSSKGSVPDSEESILKLLHEVDDSVRRITAQMKLINDKRNFRNRDSAIEFIALGLVTLLPTEYRIPLAGILGSITAFGVLRSNRELLEEHNLLRANPFYIAWQVGKE
jgi:hypothetical protein